MPHLIQRSLSLSFFLMAFTLCQKLYLLCLLFFTSSGIISYAADFTQDFTITWSPQHVNILNNAQELQLKLDNSSGSAFASTHKYMFGNIDMQIKLIPGNSASTVTAYYMSSESSNHDELDFEFLGNISGQPYIVQTNVFANGVGGREQRIYLWFDPTADFHTYSLLWNPQHIIFSVDGTPIRVFPNNQAKGLPYLNKQPMGVYSSIWNGDSWATRGGLVKIDWSQAPFVASYRNFKADACPPSTTEAASNSCIAGKWWNAETAQTLDATDRNKLKWVQQNYMVYDYCTDTARYPTPPPDCNF